MAMMMRRGVVNTALLAAKGSWVRAPASASSMYGGGLRSFSTAMAEKEVEPSPPSSQHSAGGKKDEKGVMSYWGIQTSKVTKQDGTEWKWNCFRVWIYVSFFFLFSFPFSWRKRKFRIFSGK